MNFRIFFDNLTKYKKDYNFTIMNDKFDNVTTPCEKEPQIFSNISENLEFLKSIPEENKNKVEFLVNAICHAGCQHRKEHHRLNGVH